MRDGKNNLPASSLTLAAKGGGGRVAAVVSNLKVNSEM